MKNENKPEITAERIVACEDLKADMFYLMTFLDKTIDKAVALGFNFNTQTANQLQRAFSAASKARRTVDSER